MRDTKKVLKSEKRGGVKAPIRPDACPHDVVGENGTVHVHGGGTRAGTALNAGAAGVQRGQGVHEISTRVNRATEDGVAGARRDGSRRKGHMVWDGAEQQWIVLCASQGGSNEAAGGWTLWNGRYHTESTHERNTRQQLAERQRAG